MNRDKFIEDVKEFINGAKKVENSYWKGKNIYSDEYYKQVEEYINKYCITILELFFQKGIGARVYEHYRRYCEEFNRWQLLCLKKITREKIKEVYRQIEDIKMPEFMRYEYIDENLFRLGDILIERTYGENGTLKELLVYNQRELVEDDDIF